MSGGRFCVDKKMSLLSSFNLPEAPFDRSAHCFHNDVKGSEPFLIIFAFVIIV